MATHDPSFATAQHPLSTIADTAPEPLHHGVLSPKRPSSDTRGLADIFPYYAGFSYEWAKSQLINISSGDSELILDPWNGGGTTTLAAKANGLRSIGVDLNPIANIAARLRQMTVREDDSRDFVSPTVTWRGTTGTDPLAAWFSLGTVERLRAWTSMISKKSPQESTLVYVSLFRVVKRLTRRFEGSNPTWIRRPDETEPRVHIDDAELDRLVNHEIDYLITRLRDNRIPATSSQILTSSATNLPLADNSIDIILTSPPYLTRIDYAVAYARELAVVGIDIKARRQFRESLMGTTLIRSTEAQPSGLGPEASGLLAKVSQHTSHASATYYTKQFNQYLCDLTSSFIELSRVAKHGARMILVVQDSFYKEIPVGLGKICTESAASHGWELAKQNEFIVNRILTAINASAQAYPKGVVTEKVLSFLRR